VDRINTFNVSRDGWRILPTLPSSNYDAAADRLTLMTNDEKSPSYFLAPNELVSQVKAAVGSKPVPDVTVRVEIEVPPTCWTASGWCTFLHVCCYYDLIIAMKLTFENV
jgi:hypothetical protein